MLIVSDLTVFQKKGFGVSFTGSTLAIKTEESIQVEPSAYAVIVAKPFQSDFGLIVRVSLTSEMLIF